LKKNLILTGMMGVGKTTVGKSLSLKLNMKFIDIDDIIEKQEGRTIRSIFENKGEDYFRNIEKKTTISELKKDNSVISLGGGSFLNSEIRNLILSNCISFWLDIKIELLVSRLKNIKKRPLLKKNNLSDSIKKIYLERKNIYKLANHRIDCNNKKLDLIVMTIIKLYGDIRN